MAHERLVGLHVSDDAQYAAYREGMLPILARYGGAFRYDFRIGETLISETSEIINRVFLLAFATAEDQAAFFADEAYRAVRERHFKPAVRGVTVIAEFDR